MWVTAPIWLLAFLLARPEPLIAAVLGAVFLVLIWSGPAGTVRGTAMPRSHKVPSTIVVPILFAWVLMPGLTSSRPEFGADGMPECDDAAYREIVRGAINNGPDARSGQFEASKVLNGTPAIDTIPAEAKAQLGSTASLLAGVCVHEVLTNVGARRIESHFRWVDKDSGQYFITVE